MNLTEELKKILFEKGADLAGVGSLKGVKNCQFQTGVSVAVALPGNVILDLRDGPTEEYYHLYGTLNEKLNQIVAAGEAFLKAQGYEAYAQTTDRVMVNEENISPIPHKTVAARAGLGWIGKNCLLVTPQYGSAVRISSLLTNAPLGEEEPILKSRCGGCRACVEHCPAQALKGTLWEAGMPRKEIVDAEACYQKQLEIMYERTGIRTDLCGKCFAVCTYTQKYLQSLSEE